MASESVLELPEATSQRLKQEWTWYRRRGVWKQRTFKVLKVLQIVAGSSMSLCALIEDPRILKAVAAALGVLVTCIEGYLQLDKTQELSVRWCATAEALQAEAWLHHHHAGPYAGVEATEGFRLLTERTESIVAEETRGFVKLMTQSQGIRAPTPPAAVE